MGTVPFLTRELAFRLAERAGTPCYVYDEATLRRHAAAVLAFPNVYGVTVRYAIKAAPNASLLRLFDGLGLHFDASSGPEAERAILGGIAPEKISLSAQELPANFADLVERGVSVNACSIRQIEAFGARFPGAALGLRFNPGLGSGSVRRTNVGGPASSFGIWKEAVEEARSAAQRHGLEVCRLHSHIGSGGDPEVWLRVVGLNLEIVRAFPSVRVLNLGGGYKVARMPGEASADLQAIGAPVKERMKAFASETGRRLRLEIEPGTYLVANAGAALARVQDLADTGPEGYAFLKLDAGMTEILRPSMYGAQHPMQLFPADDDPRPERDYVVVGHCCESGDILTPAPGDPEALLPRRLVEARVGDLLAIGGAGAYCASMAAKHYNSFPEAPEAAIRAGGSFELMRERQPLEQIVANERPVAW